MNKIIATSAAAAIALFSGAAYADDLSIAVRGNPAYVVAAPSVGAKPATAVYVERENGVQFGQAAAPALQASKPAGLAADPTLTKLSSEFGLTIER
jgi:hypothetical protein